MENYIISCCSTADLTEEHFARLGIPYICFHFSLDGIPYRDDLGKSISFKDFYAQMAKGAMTKTSQVNAEEFLEYFEPFLKNGQDILHICLSSGISGVLNSAIIARDTLQEKYPERKIYIVDSLGASAGYGLLVDALSELRREGKDIDYVRDWAEEHKLNVQSWFFVTDLSYLIRGGRVSKAAGTIGAILNICPLLNVNRLGKLIPRAKIRTKKRVIREIVKKMEQYAENGLDYSGKCFLSHSDCLQDAQEVASLIEERFKKLDGKVELDYIGTTIGSHTGPGTVALFFWGGERGL